MAKKLEIDYPEALYEDLIDGYSWALGVRKDGQEIHADPFPAAKSHETYDPERRTWKPTREQLVRVAIATEIAQKAANGLVNKASVDAQEKAKAEITSKVTAALESL